MRNFVHVILFTISAAFLFAGCNKVPEKTTSIVGNWYCEWSDENEELIKTTVVIKDDGRMTISYDSKSENNIGSVDLLWKAENDIFWFGYDEEELDIMELEGMKYKISDDYLKLFYDDEFSFELERK